MADAPGPWQGQLCPPGLVAVWDAAAGSSITLEIADTQRANVQINELVDSAESLSFPGARTCPGLAARCSPGCPWPRHGAQQPSPLCTARAGAAQLSPKLSGMGPRPVWGGSLPPCCSADLGSGAALYPAWECPQPRLRGRSHQCSPASVLWSLLGVAARPHCLGDGGDVSFLLHVGGWHLRGMQGMNQPGGSSALLGRSLGSPAPTMQDRVSYRRRPGSIATPMPKHP